MKTNAIPEEWGTPAKNWLKQRAGLILNDAALLGVWAEAVRQKPDPLPAKRQPESSYPTRVRGAGGHSGFNAAAMRLADVPNGPFDPRNVDKNPAIGLAFRTQRQQLLGHVTHQASLVWGDDTPEYLHWLRLEFLLDMTPDKQRGLPVTQWLLSWQEPQRTETLTEYIRLETLLQRYDDPHARDEETKAWKQRTKRVFSALWESDLRRAWNHRTLTATIALMSLRTRGTLRYWKPWDFAGTLQRQAAPTLSVVEQRQLDTWMERCATGEYDPNDLHALERFLSTLH